MRNSSTWSDLKRNSRLNLLSSNQITQLQEVIELHRVEKGEVLWEEGSEASMAIVVGQHTKVRLRKADGSVAKTFSHGAFICDVDALRTAR